MGLSVFLTSFVAIVVTTVLLISFGRRLHRGSIAAGTLLALVVTVLSGEIAARLWQLPSRYVEVGQGVLLAVTSMVVISRRVWNPIGQVFFGAFLASAVT